MEVVVGEIVVPVAGGNNVPTRKWFRGRDRALVKEALNKLRQIQVRDGKVALAPSLASSRSVAVFNPFDAPTVPAALAQVINRLEEVLELRI